MRCIINMLLLILINSISFRMVLIHVHIVNTPVTHRQRFYYDGKVAESVTNRGPNVGGSPWAWFGRCGISKVGELRSLPMLILNVLKISRAGSMTTMSGVSLSKNVTGTPLSKKEACTASNTSLQLLISNHNIPIRNQRVTIFLKQV